MCILDGFNGIRECVQANDARIKLCGKAIIIKINKFGLEKAWESSIRGEKGLTVFGNSISHQFGVTIIISIDFGIWNEHNLSHIIPVRLKSKTHSKSTP